MSATAENLIDVTELADIARRILGERVDRRAVLQPTSDAIAPALWDLIAELGWLALPIAEEQGGLGQPFSALAALYKEMGRCLGPEPLLATMICAEALSSPHSQGPRDMFEAISAGQVRVAMELKPLAGGVSASLAGDEIILNGTAKAVLSGRTATHLFLKAALDAQPVWLLVPMTPDIAIVDSPTWDKSRQVANVLFADTRVAATALVAGAEQTEPLEQAIAIHFDLGIASDSVGGARAILEETVTYTQIRHQFGRAIGSFQALKHRCATLLTRLEAGEALLDEAVAQHEAGAGDAAMLAASAKLYAAGIYRAIAVEAIQLHGGIGFTWEHDCHLFLKRALLNEQVGGSPREYRDIVAGLLVD